MTQLARVLIADGNLQNLNALSERLRDRGFVNLLEMTAAQTLSRAKTERPELLILGLHFQDGDTRALVGELKRDPATRHIPILVLVGTGDAADWPDDLASQVDGYLVAPVSDDQLRSQISVALRLNTMRTELLRRADTMAQFGIEAGDPLGDASSVGEPRVLIVAPDEAHAQPIQAALKDVAALQVEHNPNEATDRLRGHEADVLILDGCSNMRAARDACTDVRRTPTLFHLPVVAICDAGDAEAEFYAAGASVVVRAPFNASDLRAQLITMLKHAQLRAKMLEAYRTPVDRQINDSGTGLFSEQFLHKHLQSLAEDAFRWDKSLSVIVVDIPEVVRVRETYGDEPADTLLTQLGSIVSHLVRGEDLCARLDESHLCVVLPDSSMEATTFATRRISGVISYTEFALSEITPPVSVKPRLGSAEFRPGDSAADLLDRAEAAAGALAAA